VSGTVIRVLVENGNAVEAGQPLILIRPDNS
jgi:biotin carboxyl carrier protein